LELRIQTAFVIDMFAAYLNHLHVIDILLCYFLCCGQFFQHHFLALPNTFSFLFWKAELHLKEIAGH
jgi:hypothetical protein